MKKKVPVKPTHMETCRSWVYVIVCGILWICLTITSLHLLAYYVHQIRNYGLYDSESMQMGVYIIIGAFLFLFIYRDQVKKIFKIKSL